MKTYHVYDGKTKIGTVKARNEQEAQDAAVLMRAYRREAEIERKISAQYHYDDPRVMDTLDNGEW